MNLQVNVDKNMKNATGRVEMNGKLKEVVSLFSFFFQRGMRHPRECKTECKFGAKML